MSAADEPPYTTRSECFKITLARGVWVWGLPHFADSIGKFELDVSGVLALEKGAYNEPATWDTVWVHWVGPEREPAEMINLAGALNYYPYRLRVSAPGATTASLKFVGFVWKDRKKQETNIPQAS